MKALSLLGTVLAVGKLAHAADCLGVALTAIPGCAQSCFLDNAPSVGCGGSDFDCQCAQEAALYAAVEGCVSSSCPEASYQPVIDGASSAGGGGGGAGGSGSATVSGIGSIPASGTASVPSSAPASVSATATSGGGASTTSSGGGGGGIGGGGAGWTPTTVSNVATASSISAAHHQTTYSLRHVGYAVLVAMAGVMTL